MAILEKKGFLNTYSMAGSPEKTVINSESVLSANQWHNSHGNPITVLYMENGNTLLLYDYGAMNGLEHIKLQYVSRKKHL